MYKLFRVLFVSIAAIALCASALAQDNGTREEAKVMADAAIAHIKKVGPEKAFENFSKDKATWVKKDLYVWVLDLDANMKAHGTNEKLIGKNLINLKDQNGKEFIKAVAADSVIFPVGYRNRFHHPNAQVFERYRASGASLHRTDLEGALTVQLSQGGIALHGERAERPRYWYGR